MSGKLIESSASLDMTSFRSLTSAQQTLCTGAGLRRGVAVVLALAVQECWLAQLCKNPVVPSGERRRVAVALIADESTSTRWPQVVG